MTTLFSNKAVPIQPLRAPQPKLTDAKTAAVGGSNAGSGVKPAAAGSTENITDGAGYLARAVSMHLAGKPQEAVQLLSRAISSGFASPEIHRALAHIQFEREEFQEAAKSYRTLTHLKPQYAMGWFNLGVCLERMGAWDEALPVFQTCCTLDPKNLEAQLGSGVCHLRMEDPKSALAFFDRCLQLAPGHEDAAFGKASALQSLRRPDEAAVIYQAILERDPQSDESLSNLVLIGMSKEDFDMVR